MSVIDYDALVSNGESKSPDENQMVSTSTETSGNISSPAPPPSPGKAKSDYRRAQKYITKVPGASEGSRNETLNNLAYRLLECFGNLTQDEHRSLCLEFNQKCSPPLPENEALATIESAWNGCHRNSKVGSDTKTTSTSKSPKKKPEPVSDESITNLPVDSWPSALSEKAFHGIAGEVVRTIAPHTEADDAALLTQFLVMFGNVIGHIPYWQVGGDYHFSNMFMVLVGKTGRGRKGTALSEIKRLFTNVDQNWLTYRVLSGLSSGEGLINQVRDATTKTDPDTGEVKIDDPGVEDKRLLITESEFVQILKQCERAGNTLSPIIRNAWDCGDLSTLTRQSSLHATGAHISIIGHITKTELCRYLTTTETANGFANRFLWVCVKRSKLLANGGNLQISSIEGIGIRLREIIQFAQKNTLPIVRDHDADELWEKVYPQLSEEREGLAAAICGRSEPQTMRLAMIYALLDQSVLIRREHLEAALVVWYYCQESAECIFGSSLGDPVADEIMQALKRKQKGLTRTEISKCLQGHKKSDDIGRALGVLYQAGLASVTREASEGRPTERWFWHEYAKSE